MIAARRVESNQDRPSRDGNTRQITSTTTSNARAAQVRATQRVMVNVRFCLESSICRNDLAAQLVHLSGRHLLDDGD